mmetsp:Transcript_131147/g.379377  ORF Transcript_131147/g.379377 Transcript_131147/m.379377 type:complete len:267 (+) Transcript_131147:169-969(+)
MLRDSSASRCWSARAGAPSGSTTPCGARSSMAGRRCCRRRGRPCSSPAFGGMWSTARPWWSSRPRAGASRRRSVRLSPCGRRPFRSRRGRTSRTHRRSACTGSKSTTFPGSSATPSRSSTAAPCGTSTRRPAASPRSPPASAPCRRRRRASSSGASAQACATQRRSLPGTPWVGASTPSSASRRRSTHPAHRRGLRSRFSASGARNCVGSRRPWRARLRSPPTPCPSQCHTRSACCTSTGRPGLCCRARGRHGRCPGRRPSCGSGA